MLPIMAKAICFMSSVILFTSSCFLQLILLALPLQVISLQSHGKTNNATHRLHSNRRTFAATSLDTPSPSSVEKRVVVDESASVNTILPKAYTLQKRAVHLSEPDIWKLAVAGSVATLVSDISMHPLDCIKTLQQTEAGIGLSMVQAADFIYRIGGPLGFTKGFLIWGICDALGGALKFSTYEGLKRRIFQKKTWHAEEDDDDDEIREGDWSTLRNSIIFLLAALSFVASSVVTVPGELLKQHLQMGHYTGCLEAFWTIVEKQGVSGLYNGYDGVLLRDTPYTALELGLYDVFTAVYVRILRNWHLEDKERDHEERAALQSKEKTLIAGLTGGVAGLLTSPLDTVKTKATLDFVGRSFWDTAMLTIQDHGPGALFCGSAARVAWLIPVTAIYLPTYDFIKAKIHEHHRNVSTQ